MRIEYHEDYEAMSQVAATSIARQILIKPNSILGFATGSTPQKTYEILVEFYRLGILDFSQLTTFNLDEYVGLPPTHSQSYFYFMQQNLFGKTNIPPRNIHLPSGIALDLEQECSGYEEAIQAAGGIDLQLLGIGPNGHIGFNEPGTTLNSTTHVVSLSQATIQANSRFFQSSEEIPRQAITMGIKTIMNSRKILLLVSGMGKGEIIQKALNGPITEDLPASVLQLHPDVTVLVDRSIVGRE